MVTLRLEDHIGRVEWVTCHVPESQSVVGGVKLLVVAVVGRGDVVGGRRVICCAAMVGVTDTDTGNIGDNEAQNGIWQCVLVVCNDWVGYLMSTSVDGLNPSTKGRIRLVYR